MQMHVIKELLAMFSQDEALGESQPSSPTSDEENLCTISRQAVDGSSDPGVLQLQAWLQGNEVLLLVYSGSSTSFVDSTLADKLNGAIPLQRACCVRVADGVTLQCLDYIPNCQWITQGQEFCTDFKILKLGAYDAILGMDWLRKQSPMNIDWIQQHLTITTAIGLLTLSATSSEGQQCSAIPAQGLLKACKQGSFAHIIHLNALKEAAISGAPIPTDILRILRVCIYQSHR